MNIVIKLLIWTDTDLMTNGIVSLNKQFKSQQNKQTLRVMRVRFLVCMVAHMDVRVFVLHTFICILYPLGVYTGTHDDCTVALP